MFEIAFSFQGRLGRLPFFLGSMALGLATIVGFVVPFAGVGVAAKRHEGAVVVLLGLAQLPFAGCGAACRCTSAASAIGAGSSLAEATPAR